MVTRRGFLIGGTVAAGAAVTGLAAWQGRVAEHLDDALASRAPGTDTAGGPAGTTAPSRTILVVLALNGGNDALDTLVPVTAGRYHDARPELGRKDDRVVPLPGADAFGLAAELAPLAPLWAARRLAAVAGVGFEGQSRSHFAALDTWWSAQPGRTRTTGWLGRWLDEAADPGNPLTAVALGANAPMLAGARAQSTVILDPASFSLRAPRGADAAQLAAAFRATAVPASGVDLVAAAQSALPRTLDAVDTLAPALAAARDKDGGDAGGGAAALLGVAARLIDLDVGTRVVVVAADGFDTHSDQERRHAALLTDIGKGVADFVAEIDRQGRGDRVLLMTTSEFGRRVAENGGGTDHGKGGVELLVGPAGGALPGGAVTGGYDLDHLDDGDLPVVLDTRSVYATALDWLGGPTDEILGGRFERLGR